MMNSLKRHLNVPLTLILSVTAILRIALAFRSEYLLYGLYYQEDAFYLLNCAEHFARGQGFTVDGVHPTNGVQPLLVLLYAPLFLIADFDKTLMIRISFIYPMIFDCVSVYLVYRLLILIRRDRHDSSNALWTPLLGAMLYGMLFPVFVHTVSGLETGLLSMLLLLSLYQYAKLSINRDQGKGLQLKQYVVLGVTLGLTVLSRIDSAIIVAAICIWELLRPHPGRLLRASIICFTSFIVSLPWWIYNVYAFGNLLPQSGLSQSIESVTTWNAFQMVSTIADCLTVFFSVTKMLHMSAYVYVAWSLFVFSCVWVCLRLFPLRRFILMHYHLQFLLPVVVACLCYVVYYVAFFSAPYFIPRYMQPFRIVMILVAAMCIPIIVSRWKKQRPTRIVLWFVAIAAVLNTALRYPRNFYTKVNSSFYGAGNWALRHPGDKVGMHQSGITGFIAPNIVNLDGKVNFNALKAKLDNKLGKYIVDENITYLADWDTLIIPIIRDVNKYGVEFEFVDSVDDVKIYKRIH